uniref:Uncharacterized protein n=1 Tax=Timema bartmani TaxID=61472 RepID=A0A7R9F3K6_9NEOP|nr:unnamed protein product [Timema bartmani]
MVTREGQLVTEGDGGLNLGADTYWSHAHDLQGVEEAPDDNTGNRIPLIPFKVSVPNDVVTGEEGRSLADKADGNFKRRTAFDGDRMSEGRSLADKADGNFKRRTPFDGDRMSLEKRQVVHGSLQARGGQSCADRTAPTNVDPMARKANGTTLWRNLDDGKTVTKHVEMMAAGGRVAGVG